MWCLPAGAGVGESASTTFAAERFSTPDVCENQFCYSCDEAGPGLAVGDSGAGAIEVDRHVRVLSLAVVGNDSRSDVTRSALWASVFPSDAAQ
jgi:hypothetical protein